MKIKFILLFAVLLFSSGLSIIREYLFLWINMLITNSNINTNNTPPPAFLSQLSTAELLWLKWGLTIFFAFVSYLLFRYIVNYFFRNKSYTTLVNYLYIAIAGVLFILYPLYLLIKNNLLYHLIHEILLLTQTPLLLIIVFPILYFHHKHNASKAF
jgi:hypothetical protein